MPDTGPQHRDMPADSVSKPSADADHKPVMDEVSEADKADEKSRRSLVLIRRLYDLYMKPYTGTIGIACIFMVVAAIMTGAMAKLMEPIVDDVFSAGNRAMLFPVAGAVLAAFVIRGVSTYLHNVFMNRVGQGVVADIQRQLSSHLIRADLAYLQSRSSGQLISNMISDVNVMRTAMAECLLGFVRSTLTLAILVGVMFFQDWHLASVCFVVMPLAAIMVARIGKRLRRVSIKTQSELGEFSAQLNETFQAIRQVKAYGMESHEEARLNTVIQRLYDLAHRGFRVAAFATPISELLSGFAIVTVIIYGGFRVIEGDSTAGEVFSFITAFLLAYEPMKKLAKLNGTLQMGLGAAERVLHVLSIQPAVVDREQVSELKVEKPSIRFEGVHFDYNPEKPALRGVDLTVEPGQRVALVGPSGAGKSTILNLIPRFYDVTAGRVLIDGTDIRDVSLESLRGNIALVSQEISIFDASIRSNIAYGRQGASEDEIIAAAKEAAAHDFITKLPQGYDTRVGEHGMTLSGGQRQRIAIARAMLRNAPILLLDEATSALDAESERLVQAALDRLQEGRTTLVIAHRLSTIIDSDVIYVVDQGRVVESGVHTALLAQQGIYQRLYGQQDG